MVDNYIINTIEASLNVSVFRHKLYSTNIANLEIPGYKKYRVSFKEALKEALENGENP